MSARTHAVGCPVPRGGKIRWICTCTPQTLLRARLDKAFRDAAAFVARCPRTKGVETS